MAKLGTRQLVISIGGTDRTAECSKAVITSAGADRDFVTFADAATGGARDYFLEFTAAQDLDVDTLWDIVWTGAGTTVPVLLKPYGNVAASASQPHYTANAVVSEPDGDFIGGEADSSSTARMTFEGKWELTAKPVKVVS